MRFSIGPQTETPINFMRKVGYLRWRDPRTDKYSYIRKISRAFYPRFHIHLFKDTADNIHVDLHLDARKPLHKKVARCSENDSEVVIVESERIENMLLR